MTDFQINDHILAKECEGIAQDAYDQARQDHPDFDADDVRDTIDDYIHQTCDGHQWVIYNYQALKVCADCNVSDGEEFLEEIGLPEDVTIYKLASIIVYGELRARASAALEEIIEAAGTV